METAFNTALAINPLTDRDAAASELARTYAEQIDKEDDSTQLAKLGTAYLAVLEALQMTPRARAAAQKGMKANDQPAGSKLDELRERRARKSRAEAVDATSS